MVDLMMVAHVSTRVDLQVGVSETKRKSFDTVEFRHELIYMSIMTDQATHYQHRLPTAERGRNQDKSRDDKIIRATLELLAEVGYDALTMTDVAARASASKATLYRRWTQKSDLVADAVATLDPIAPPVYLGTSLRDDLLALLATAGNCDDLPEAVTATREMARSNPELYQTLSDRFGKFVRAELAAIAERYLTSTDLDLDVIGDTIVALLSHYAGPAGASVSRKRIIKLVDEVLTVLMTGRRA
ncbi:helix-turn-helix domain-containing protein [Mesorhizobium sp. CN2-181]|uniref:TetR/AcrR family transcriptional regulator n=1 Tax=Mesorhizobium yinganensis TaxID=3157707 RepID=UPI0032B79CD4